MPSRADTHDLDKLKRWQKDLEATPDGAPPAFAIFLVSGEDRAAHDAFRAFRSSFEERNLGFAHLVIFGQHGISATARALQGELELPEDMLPILVVFGVAAEPQVVPLPAGATDEAEPEGDNGWHSALARAERIVDAGIRASGPPQLNRALRKRLAGICTAVVTALGGQAEG